jgi:hypothetical protein
VNDDVASGQNSAAGLVKAEAIAANVTSDRGDASCGHCRELVFTEFGSQSIKRVVLQDLSSHSLFNGGTTTGPNQQDDVAIGHGAEQSLEQVGPEETGGAGDEQPFAGKCVTNHERMFTTW